MRIGPQVVQSPPNARGIGRGHADYLSAGSAKGSFIYFTCTQTFHASSANTSEHNYSQSRVQYSTYPYTCIAWLTCWVQSVHIFTYTLKHKSSPNASLVQTLLLFVHSVFPLTTHLPIKLSFMMFTLKRARVSRFACITMLIPAPMLSPVSSGCRRCSRAPL